MKISYADTELQIVMLALMDFESYVWDCATPEHIWEKFGIEPWTMKAVITKAKKKTATALEENNVWMRPSIAKQIKGSSNA